MTLYENRLIGQVGRVLAYGPGDLGSIPGCVIPKTFKMVFDTTLLNTQQYKVLIKGKVEKSRKRSSVLPCCSYWKGILLVVLDYSRKLYLLTLNREIYKKIGLTQGPFQEEQGQKLFTPVGIPLLGKNLWHKTNKSNPTLFIYMGVRKCVCICLQVWVYVCDYVCMKVYVCVCASERDHDYIYIYIYIYIYSHKGGTLRIMAITRKDGISNLSSNPGKHCLHFTLY